MRNLPVQYHVKHESFQPWPVMSSHEILSACHRWVILFVVSTEFSVVKLISTGDVQALCRYILWMLIAHDQVHLLPSQQ